MFEFILYIHLTNLNIPSPSFVDIQLQYLFYIISKAPFKHEEDDADEGA